MSRRFVVLALLLGACWWKSVEPPGPRVPPPVNEVRGPMMVQMHDPPPCAQFDVGDPACLDKCPAEAPDGWDGCMKMVAEMIAQGYSCPTMNPRKCIAPAQAPPPCATTPTGCVTVKSRIVGVSVQGAVVVIQIGAGTNHGVTKTWRGTVVDSNDRPVPGGQVVLVRVDKHVTVGKVQLTPQQIQNNPFVRLEP